MSLLPKGVLQSRLAPHFTQHLNMLLCYHHLQPVPWWWEYSPFRHFKMRDKLFENVFYPAHVELRGDLGRMQYSMAMVMVYHACPRVHPGETLLQSPSSRQDQRTGRKAGLLRHSSGRDWCHNAGLKWGCWRCWSRSIRPTGALRARTGRV